MIWSLLAQAMSHLTSYFGFASSPRTTPHIQHGGICVHVYQTRKDAVYTSGYIPAQRNTIWRLFEVPWTHLEDFRDEEDMLKEIVREEIQTLHS